MNRPQVILVIHNVRSCHNVGSMLRTADGLGVSKVYFSGYSPYPLRKKDPRLPHIAAKAAAQISKTALGAERSVAWAVEPDFSKLAQRLKDDKWQMVALEQTSGAKALKDWSPTGKVALVVGAEVGGLDKSVLKLCDEAVYIPMKGSKESFNVSVAAAISLWQLLR